MKKMANLLILTFVLLSGCSTGKTTEMPETKAASANFKPKLDVSYEINGRTAVFHFMTDMKISPEHFGLQNVKGEGHIHLYIDDGDKVTVTEDKYTAENLKPGTHTIKVSLHNNDHTPYDMTKELTFEIK